MSQLEHVRRPVPPASALRWSPQIHISHFLLWTLTSALCLAALRASYSVYGEVAFIQQTSGLIYSIIAGATITGTIALVSVRIRTGPPLLWHPGHWLLLVGAVTSLTTLSVVCYVFVSGQPANSGATHFLLGVLFLFPPIAFSNAAHRQHYKARHWRALFVGLALVALSQSAYHFGLTLSPGNAGQWMALVATLPAWGNAMLSTGMLFASIVEVFTGQQRDWLHWIGIATQMASSCANLAWFFV